MSQPAIELDGKYTEEQLVNPKSKDEILSALENDVKTSEWILAALHRQWYESIFWTIGEQYMEWNQRTRRFQIRPARQYIPRSVTNYILPHVETGVAMMMDAMPAPKVVPTTKDDADREAAEVATGILRFRDEQQQFEQKKRDAANWAVITGTCYLQSVLDRANAERIRVPVMKRETQIVTDPETGQPILGPNNEPISETVESEVIDPESGEPEYEEIVMADEGVNVLSPFEIIPDWSARYPWEFRRYTHFRAQSRDWIGRVFGAAAKKKVKPEKGLGILSFYQLKVLDIITRSSATGRLGLPTAFGGSAADWRFMEDAAVVKSRYMLPTTENKNGRLMITAGDQVLYSGDNPYGDRLNLFTLRWSVLPGSIWGFGMVRNLIMPQKRLNGIDTQDDLIRKTMGNPGWLVAKRSQFNAVLGTSEPGHIYTYKHVASQPAPTRLDPKAPAPFNREQRNGIIQDMQEISGMRNVLMGVNPVGVNAGIQLEALTEQAAKRFQPGIADNRSELKRSYTTRLQVAQNAPAWQVPRAVELVGEDGERDVKKFMATDFKGNLAVEIEAVPIVSFSQAMKKQAFKDAVGMQLIDLVNSPQNRDKARKIMALSEFDEAYTLDYKRAQMENEKLLAGEDVPKGKWDDDEIHMQVHMRLAKSRRFDDLPLQVRQNIERHLDLHIIRTIPPEALAPPAGAPGAPAGGGPPMPGAPGGAPPGPPGPPAAGEPGPARPPMTPGEEAQATMPSPQAGTA